MTAAPATDSLSLPALVRAAWHDGRRAWGPLVLFEAAFKLLEAWLLVPALALLLAAVLARAGHVAVSNADILAFLLTPWGVLYAVLAGTAAVALWLLEHAGLMALAAQSGPPRLALLRALRAAAGITKLGLVKLVLIALASTPFLLLAGLTYYALLTGHDIYFYWKERPPVFWLATVLGVLILLAATAAALVLLTRWSLALPITLFEHRLAPAALRESAARVRGAARRIGLILVGWLLALALTGALFAAAFRALARAALAGAGDRPFARILVMLAVEGLLLTVLSAVTAVGLALLTRRIYLARSGPVPKEEPPTDTSLARTPPRVLRLALAALASAMLAPLALWALLAWTLPDRAPVRVTAHRGHAAAAPENTLAAFQKALDLGADYVEMDVQMTADGAVVLLHDRDLKRVAGDPRRLEDLTLAEVRELDVGRWFSPEFAAQRVPTLQDVIRLCRGRAKMNIEMKFFSPDRRLAAATARVIRDEDALADCLVTCFELDALDEARRHTPGLRVGLTVGHALGDISRLDVDALSVRADFLTDRLIRDAHRQGREVHAWTVNDPRQMATLIERGVDNVITSNLEPALQVRDRWSTLTAAERLLLASRLLLGVGLEG